MTEQRLRDLLHEQVADLAPVDLGARAWAGARRTRQRRAAMVAGSAVAVLAVVAGSLALTRGDGGDPADPAPTSTDGTQGGTAPAVSRGSDYRGAPTWWAPSIADEADLPLLAGTPLPDQIDLAEGAPAHRPGVRAVAVFEVKTESAEPGRVVVIGTDGASYALDVGRLVRVTDEEGNAQSALTQESVAPDGKHVFFIQESSIEVYDLMAGTWASYDTVPWLAEGARWLNDAEVWVPGELGRPDGVGTTYDVTGAGIDSSSDAPVVPRVWDTSDEPWGPIRASGSDGAAQAIFLSGVAVDPSDRSTAGSDAVAARVGPTEGEDVHVLVMPGMDEGRWKGCCPVVGWLDDETVLLQSRGNTSRILAWRVGTGDLQRVSRITGWEPGIEVPIGSFADLR